MLPPLPVVYHITKGRFWMTGGDKAELGFATVSSPTNRPNSDSDPATPRVELGTTGRRTNARHGSHSRG